MLSDCIIFIAAAATLTQTLTDMWYWRRTCAASKHVRLCVHSHVWWDERPTKKKLTVNILSVEQASAATALLNPGAGDNRFESLFVIVLLVWCWYRWNRQSGRCRPAQWREISSPFVNASPLLAIYPSIHHRITMWTRIVCCLFITRSYYSVPFYCFQREAVPSVRVALREMVISATDWTVVIVYYF